MAGYKKGTVQGALSRHSNIDLDINYNDNGRSFKAVQHSGHFKMCYPGDICSFQHSGVSAP